MTDNLPATTSPGTELARREPPIATADTDGWTTVIAQVAKLADHIAGTQFVPRDLRGSSASVCAAILYGREVGLPPMTALTQTHVIEGKPAASAEAMRALVIAQGHELEVVEATGALVTMRARRRGSETWTSISWSLDMARAAGLLHKDNWKHYPRQMLTARCSAELIRLVFPDVIHGMRALEELDELEAGPGGESPPVPDAGTTVRRAGTRKRKTAASSSSTTPPPSGDSGPGPASPGPGDLPLPGEDGYTGTPPVEETPEPSTGAPSPEGEREEPTEDPRHPAEAQGRAPTVEEVEQLEAETLPEPEVEDTPPPRPISKPQQRMILARLDELGLPSGERDERLRLLSGFTRREITSGNELTHQEASRLIDTLSRVGSLRELFEIIERTEEPQP